MLGNDLCQRAVKGTIPTEPLVDNNTKCILITGQPRFPLNLFWSHVGHRPCHLLNALVARALRHDSDAEVTQQDLFMLTHQHVLRLDIAVDESLVVGILQGICHLLDVGDDRREGQDGAFGMTLAQRAARGVVHDQEGDVILHVKIEDPHDMGMAEIGNEAGFLLEALHFDGIGKQRGEDFDRGLGAQAQVFTKVDFCEAALSQKAGEPIFAKLLANAINHRPVLSRKHPMFTGCPWEIGASQVVVQRK